MRRSIALAAAAILLTALATAWLLASRAAESGQDEVIARLAPQGEAHTRVKLGSATRSAIAALPPSAWEVPVPAGSRRLLLSFGADAAGIRFAVSAQVGGEWRPLLRETTESAHAGWLDRSVALGEPPPARLRFETSAPPTGLLGARAYWGSITLTGRPERSALLALTRRSPPPSVVLLSLDTLAAGRLSSFGSAQGVSPRIDDLLARSVSFRRAYAQYPNTLASHASLFTSLYPSRHGLLHHASGGPRIAPPTLASLLAEHGYATAAFTEDAYVGSVFGFDEGFDLYDDGSDARHDGGLPTEFDGDARVTFARARAWLEAHAADAPFFLFLHTYEVHQPYLLRDEEARVLAAKLSPGYDGRFAEGFRSLLATLAHNRGRTLLPPAELARLEALYAAEIQYLDRQVGELLDHLRALPGAERTLLVLTSDHGEEFGEHGKLAHGETLFEPALHVPLAFHWPAVLPPRTVGALVELIDVAPTVLELAGVESPAGHDGRSLVSLLRGEAAPEPRRAVFAELRTAWGECEQLGLGESCLLERLAVRTERFKLITSRQPLYERLYDLAADPGETADVARALPRELEALRALLDAYRAHVTSPAGAAGGDAPALDDVTRDRLRALGYLD